MSKINKRLVEFYKALSGIYPKTQVVDSQTDKTSLTFTIEYSDINNLSLIPILRLANMHKLSISQLIVEVKNGTKFLVGAVHLKDKQSDTQMSVEFDKKEKKENQELK